MKNRNLFERRRKRKQRISGFVVQFPLTSFASARHHFVLAIYNLSSMKNQKNKTSNIARGGGRDQQEDMARKLQTRIEEETPPRGNLAYPRNSVVSFGSLPISPPTLQGLTVPKKQGAAAPYTTLTEIQAQSIPHALGGRDILGAAQTGSGKTLAFCIPLLEALYRQCWNRHDGVGAIVLSPTRELAGQTYAVLQQIGRFHSNLNMGLLIGGSNTNKRRANVDQATAFQQEQWAIPTTNILICTPGRLLQHLEQTPYMDVSQLQMLVLDEADRILDMGFRDTLTRILDYLPTERQTLLFSATQTKTVQDLAVVSINRQTVEYIGVAPKKKKKTKTGEEGDTNDNDNNNDNKKEDDLETIPDRLKQAYVIVPLQHKLNCLWSFLKSHIRYKTMAFFSTCSQVRYAWDLFCRLRPGLSVLALHGKLSQQKRLEVYTKFATTPHCVLFATDVASRGLDFPNVDWVLQIDAPEDLETYIHRVGRTARFRSKGQALLLLDPEEESVIKKWPIAQKTADNKKPTLQKKSINPTKTMLVSQRAASLVAEHTTLQRLAKKSFGSYLRSLTLLPKSTWSNDEDDFDEKDQKPSTSNWNPLRLDWGAFSSSLGLAATPSLDVLKNHENRSRETVRETKNVNRKLAKLKAQIKAEKEKKKLEKKRKLRPDGEEEEDHPPRKHENEEDNFLVVKARHESLLPEEDTAITLASRHSKKIRIDGGGDHGSSNKHMVFDEDGEAEEKPRLLLTKNDTNNVDDADLAEANESYMERVRQRLEQTRELDKQEERDRIRAKHKKKKAQERADLGMDNGDENNAVVATLGGGSDDDSSSSESNDSSPGASEAHPKSGDVKDDDDDGPSSSSSSSSFSDGDSDDDDGDTNIAAQEDLALSLIRGTA